ncbi:TauD/TfdA family dioxygenase [Lentzea sp. NPDC004789]
MRQGISARSSATTVEVESPSDFGSTSSPEVNRWIPALRAAIDRHAFEFGLAAGQGYVLDNHRWLHGRRAFTGQRVVHRVNGDPLPELVVATGVRVRASSDAA